MDKTFVLSSLGNIGLAVHRGNLRDAKFFLDKLIREIEEGNLVPGEHEPAVTFLADYKALREFCS